MDWYDLTCYASEILDAKYEKVLVDDVIDQLDHLNAQQKNDLERVLNEHIILFDGTFRVNPHIKSHIDLMSGAVSKHSRPYAIPDIHLEAFKRELICLVKMGVSSPQGASEWASPTFITPKKDGRVHWVSDLRELNKVVQLRGFIEMINYYRDMWPHRSHILSPLTTKTGAPKKGVKAPPFKWTPKMQKAFEEMKALMAAEVLCVYLNHNKPFKIYSDASNYQLGACIMQDNHPVAYYSYSRKLNSAQRNYATIDKELFGVVVTLREF